jgi:hypothetical protein
MNKQLFIFLIVAVMVSACGKSVTATPTSTPPPPTSTPKILPTDTPLPTVTPVCASPNPTQADVDRALSYTHDVFGAPEWNQSYTVSDSSVAVIWQNAPLGAAVYLEALIFPCGYEEPDLDKYFSDQNWKLIFANYESYELTRACKRDDGLRLYEFKTHNQGFEYGIKYWVKSDTDTRVISTMLVFPLVSKLLLDEYSSMLFPDYSTCP